MPGEYVIARESGDANYGELEPLYKQHYGEMRERLSANGQEIGEFNPRLNEYFEAWGAGWLLNYVVRLEGEPVGYANIYLTNDMHNGELIAQEDAIYMLPEHRNGTGKKLAQRILDDLREMGVKRAFIEPVTDLRVEVIWQRMGFEPLATKMVYRF